MNLQTPIILSEGVKDEILNMLASTSYWQMQMTPERRQAALKQIKHFRNLVNGNYHATMWIARVFQRYLIAKGSRDDAKNEKKFKELCKNGYDSSRIVDDMNKLVHPTQRGEAFDAYHRYWNEAEASTAMMQVEQPRSKWTTNEQGVLEPTYERKPLKTVVQNALSNIQFRDAVTGKDLPYNEIYNAINAAAAAFKESKELMQGKIVMSFDDAASTTWNWIDALYCDTESVHMGHCGNRANPKPGDSLLSLRQMRSGMRAPHLTFIYNKNSKTLGEMKGRANAKPNAKYHEFIVQLLIKMPDPINIEYLNGSGYNAGNNFSLNDLNEQHFKQLVQHNADLVKRQIAMSGKVDEYQKLDDKHVAWFRQVVPDAMKQEPQETYTQKYMQDEK
jgi:hypothetical protein